MELQLLRGRFPNNALVENCGSLVNEFFCARSVDNHSYEGRLFLTEKALFFVSTYSVAISYDKALKLEDIKEVVALQRIIPSIEFILDKGKEVFTNFHDLKKTISALKDHLPNQVGLEVKKQAFHHKFSRLTSVPVKSHANTSKNSHSTSHPLKLRTHTQTLLCPYFSRSGFCPRKDFCQYTHEFPSTMTISSSPTSPSREQQKTSSMEKLSNPTIRALGQELFRSISSPASTNDNEQTERVDVEVKKGTENGVEESFSVKDISEQQKMEVEDSTNTVTILPDLSQYLLEDGQVLAGIDEKEEEEEEEEEEERSRTPEPVSKLDKTRFDYAQKLIENVDIPNVPSTFSFGVQNKSSEGTSNAFSFISATNLGKRKTVDTDNSDVMEGLVVEDDDTGSLEGDLDMESQLKMLENFKLQQQKPKKRVTIVTEEENSQDGVVPSPPPPLPLPPPSYPGWTPDDSYLYEYGSDDEEEYSEEFPPIIMPNKLTIFPASHISRDDINSGDKVILSPEILMACEQRQLTYPMAFCFENKVVGSLVHAGVLEFTSPLPNTAYLPQWMFEHLGICDGDEVDFQHVDLPKGTFVQLQPVSSAWLGVPYDKRMAIMEFQLRNFQTLSEGTKVTIMYELNRYTFKVLSCKPAKGISIVDSDLTTDVVEPADFNRFHSVEEWQAENIPLSEPIQCTVKAGTYRHFVLLSLPGKELPDRLQVEVKQDSGDPDLFLCQTCSTPSRSRYTWCNQDIGDSIVYLSTDDKDYSVNKSLFAGVTSLSEETKFTLCFSPEIKTNGMSVTTGITGGHVLRSTDSTVTTTSVGSAGYVLRSTTGSSISSGISSSEEDTQDESDGHLIPPDHGQCSYCGSIMPQLRLLMHERHCATSNFKCPVCNRCFPKSAEKKHHFIAHELLRCECGEEHSQLALHHHQLTQCSKRSVKCPFKWCQLSFPLDQLHHHENLCGRKQVSCPVCSEDVSQLELEMHLEAFHLVEVDKLDWTKPIGSQTFSYKPKQPKFKCHCGTGFDFEDDLQVHQLTECSPQSFDDGDLVG